MPENVMKLLGTYEIKVNQLYNRFETINSEDEENQEIAINSEEKEEKVLFFIFEEDSFNELAIFDEDDLDCILK